MTNQGAFFPLLRDGNWVRELRVISFLRWFFLVAGCLSPFCAVGQIDPVNRELIQVGYNAAFQGHSPLAFYAFYYLNKPSFFTTNLTLRLAVAPTYLDSELGISEVLGEDTDMGIGMAGGGFADNYAEIRRGTFRQSESFTGHSGEFSLSLYHLFNRGSQIPLNGVLRGTAHYSTYSRDDETAPGFAPVNDHGTFTVRTGLRWGGREPTLFPSLAMELSAWYEGIFRTESSTYGFGDRKLEAQTHLFWGEALLAYTLPEWKHSIYVSLTAGSSVDPDRFSTYRLGALLPLVSEFPLSLPGYYYQEISAKSFGLFGVNYIVPLDEKQRWNFNGTLTTAVVQYLEGLEQAGNSHTGIGVGILYKSRSFKAMLGYAYGVDAIRSGGRGAHSIGLLMQMDWAQARDALFNPEEPNRWRGLQRVLGVFGN
jgi:hypothetical protein